jgi:hypothetical protein
MAETDTPINTNTEPPKKPDQIQIQFELAKEIENEIYQKKENPSTTFSPNIQKFISKFEEIYQFEQKYPPKKADVLGAKEPLTETEQKDIQQKERNKQFLKDALGNFGGFLYTTWKREIHSETIDFNPYEKEPFDTVKNPSRIGKNN